jgi:hypothetical protein
MCQWLSGPPGEWIGQSRTRSIFARRPELRTCSSYTYLDPRTYGVLGRFRCSWCKQAPGSIRPRQTQSRQRIGRGLRVPLARPTRQRCTAGTSLDGPRALGGTGRIQNCATGQSSLRPGTSGSSQASRGVRMCLGGQAVVEQPRLGEHLRIRRRVGVEADNRRDRLWSGH